MRTGLLAVVLASAVALAAAITDREGRIVGGIRSEIGQYPELVSVLTDPLFGQGEHLCGGIIMNDNHVLTTASCVQDQSATSLKVMGAGINLGGTAGFEEFKNVQRMFIHEDFDLANRINDLAVLRTSHNFVFVSGLINPAVFPPNNTEPENLTPVALAGWGIDGYEGASSSWQNTINATYISNAECRTYYGDTLDVNNGCIIGDAGQGICDGDEGGPVIAEGVSIAMVSWHVGCDAYPGVVTNLSPYVDWILSKMEA